MKNKITLRKLLIAVITCFALSIGAHAQSPSVSDAFSRMDSISPTLYAGSFTIMLDDTNNVSQLETKLGTYQDGTDLLNYTYNYDVTTGLPSGWTYSRNGNIIKLGIGTYADKIMYFGQVRVKDTNGNWSDAFKFVAN